jgi:4-aminobutyrate--pyruvate transaminase
MYEALVEPVSEVGVFGHGYTYSGHPLACAVASKVLEIYQRDRLFEHAARSVLICRSALRTSANTRWWARCEAWD